MSVTGKDFKRHHLVMASQTELIRSVPGVTASGEKPVLWGTVFCVITNTAVGGKLR